jgi:dipeptidyl aminopeptidase/acylaminoacyl peptidase
MNQNKSRKNIIFTFFSLFIFLLTVAYLNFKGYISATDNLVNQKDTPADLKKILTEIKIKDIDITGKIIFEENNRLFVLNPQTQEKEQLIDETIVTFPGVLGDGRLYFWQGPASPFEWLYIQKGKQFEKHRIPLQKNDGGLTSQTPPIVSADGTYLVFTSDRDATDNYYRRSLYKYSLDDSSLTKLTENKSMTVYDALISPNGKIIAFTYQNIEPGKASSPTALGIVINGTKNVNLFPKVTVNNASIAFSYDSQYVLLTTTTGPSVFEIEKGKTVDSLQKGVFRAITKNNSIIIETPYEIDNSDFVNNCLDGAPLKINANNQIDLYSLTNGKLEKIKSGKTNDALIYMDSKNSLSQVSKDSSNVLVFIQNNQFCRPTLGVFNLNSQSLSSLSLPTEKSYIWIEEK